LCQIKKPQVVKAVLEEISQVYIYIYIPTVLIKYPRTGSDISAHKSLLFFFQKTKRIAEEEKRESFGPQGNIHPFFFLGEGAWKNEN